ncbi:hypothetical protein [Xanthomarina sp. F2636L]|uniref:hypothetical protein n=1 Tax=Xanthomarina sp. F2636L TaxID=2996018 RepID=UPI00225DD12E|nr:hypothetical protein [Xanthomarina sp. F2636L]MCX7552128.1 hypothetical protein [Xanthomarina sp. F2636L]
MKSTITLYMFLISLASFSANINKELKTINENIFIAIKTNNLELLKPYFFNDDNIKLYKNAFDMTDEDIVSLRNEGKAPYATYELLKKIRNEDDRGTINWESTKFINIPRFNEIENLIPQRNKQAELYTTYIPFSEGEKKWKIKVAYLKTEKGFFVFHISKKHFEFKDLIISSNPNFEGKWFVENTNPIYYYFIKKNGDEYVFEHSKQERIMTGRIKEGVIKLPINDTVTITCIIDENDNLIMSNDNLISFQKLIRLLD